MTIIYLISTRGHGKGGHFHSLNTIANAIGVLEDVHVINIGLRLTSVLDSFNYNVHFVDFNGFNFFSAFSKLKSIIDPLNPTVIHAFDIESFAFSRIFSLFRKQVSFLNKCGGPNPKKYFPKSDVLFLFSKENFDYFKNKRRYQDTKHVMIPNRVQSVKIDYDRVNLFRSKHKLLDITILRIARIGEHYHKSIIQGINLVGFLKSKQILAKLVVIGTIQNEKIYREILYYIKAQKLENEVIIETSESFTHNASELIALGDVVIGTGRNFMEASSLNKLLLVPYMNSDFPLLVTNKNFNNIFATNFSPRSQIFDFDENANLKAIYMNIKQKNEITSIDWFNTFFDVKEGTKTYIKIYQEASYYVKFNFIDVVLNTFYTFKSFAFRR